MKDLLLLVADKNMEFAARAILERPRSLGIRAINFETWQHPHRDSGVRTTGPALIRESSRLFSHGLIMLDWEGSGSERADAVELEADLDAELFRHWGTRAKAIVIEPELDVWMWGTEATVARVLGWPLGQSVRDWLDQAAYILNEDGKPERPKEAFEAVLRQLKQPRSSAYYREMLSRLSFERCTDLAFNRLRTVLRRWFSG